jgi:hypothetical protein
MKTYETLTSILALGVMVSCGNGGTRTSLSDSATDSGVNSSLTADPATGNFTMGMPTNGVTSSDSANGSMTGEITSNDVSASGMTTSSTSEGSTTGDPGPVNRCKIQPNGDGVGACDKRPPPETFEPIIEWEWTSPADSKGSMVTPLVVSLTDDNGDGVVDLCDTPDIVVVVYQGLLNPSDRFGHIYVLDGATGALHFKIEEAIYPYATPAVGDIDNDGISDIVAVGYDGLDAYLMAFDHDGAKKWKSTTVTESSTGSDWFSLLIADLDNDGDPEIFSGYQLFDHHGVLQWASADYAYDDAPTAADLDGDGDLELILESAAYHHDGSVYYKLPGMGTAWPQVANLDEDSEPEVLLTGDSIVVLEHTGEVKSKFLNGSYFASTIADFDGDGISDFGASRLTIFSTTRVNDGTEIWSAPISDFTGLAGGSAFDFNSDGIFEVVYAGEQNVFVFGESGQVLMQIPHSSVTYVEYPVVADVDNDGSAEIVVVSNYGDGPTVQVIGDKENRWPQARRIWNQDSYHVNNVNEDGTVPQYEQPSWNTHNTFRANSTLSSGGACQ